jgi:hypothetical protein
LGGRTHTVRKYLSVTRPPRKGDKIFKVIDVNGGNTSDSILKASGERFIGSVVSNECENESHLKEQYLFQQTQYFQYEKKRIECLKFHNIL